ncbi:unnamed protein product, partial [Rotaria sp. Silwood1]
MALSITAIYPDIKINGLIEGFYWSSSNAVQGQADFYSKQQRDNLISVMGEGLNYYIFCPHETGNDAFTMTLWNAQQVIEWSDTISKASNVSIIFGLRPRWIEDVQTSLKKIQSKLEQLASVGIRYYILCWDDSSGAGTNAQMELQRDLIKALTYVCSLTSVEQYLALLVRFYCLMNLKFHPCRTAINPSSSSKPRFEQTENNEASFNNDTINNDGGVTVMYQLNDNKEISNWVQMLPSQPISIDPQIGLSNSNIKNQECL